MVTWYGQKKLQIGLWPPLRSTMEQTAQTAWIDWIAGGIALVILLGGMVMLLSGVGAMNQKK
jgi:hypothetical protein